jgi:hypothetical protein
MWRQRVEDLLWLASSCFILYYGDLETNFFSLLANDPRVWRYTKMSTQTLTLINKAKIFAL